MHDDVLRRLVHHAVDQRTASFTPNSFLAQQVIAKGKETKPMKKKITLGLVLALLLLLISVTALALTHLEELKAVWEDSYARMNTYGGFYAVPMEEFDLKGFEEDYTAGTGLERKEDLVINTVPQEGDLPYEEAYLIAIAAITEKFGTPESEIEAMGVYPEFFKSVYNDDVSEWEFYFSPRTNVNIEEDNTYPPPGEYRVYIESPSGEVTYCGWYLDEFFPDYAKRTWEAGKHQYVYERAKGNAFSDFFLMEADQREYFLQLFREDGFDLSPFQLTDEALLENLSFTLEFYDGGENLMHADLPGIREALAVMEEKYGLTPDLMDDLYYAALPSPAASDTLDICFSFNYDLAARAGSELPYPYGLNAFCHVARKHLGSFMVILDKDNFQVQNVIRHIDAKNPGTGEKLLENSVWEKELILKLPALTGQLKQLTLAEGESTMELGIRYDEIMRSFGGSMEEFPSRRLTAHDVQQDQAIQIATAALAEKLRLSPGDVLLAYPQVQATYVPQTAAWSVQFFTEDQTRAEYIYETLVDAQNGNVLSIFDYTQGNG